MAWSNIYTYIPNLPPLEITLPILIIAIVLLLPLTIIPWHYVALYYLFTAMCIYIIVALLIQLIYIAFKRLVRLLWDTMDVIRVYTPFYRRIDTLHRHYTDRIPATPPKENSGLPNQASQRGLEGVISGVSIEEVIKRMNARTPSKPISSTSTTIHIPSITCNLDFDLTSSLPAIAPPLNQSPSTTSPGHFDASESTLDWDTPTPPGHIDGSESTLDLNASTSPEPLHVSELTPDLDAPTLPEDMHTPQPMLDLNAKMDNGSADHHQDEEITPDAGPVPTEITQTCPENLLPGDSTATHTDTSLDPTIEQQTSDSDVKGRTTVRDTGNKSCSDPAQLDATADISYTVVPDAMVNPPELGVVITGKVTSFSSDPISTNGDNTLSSTDPFEALREDIYFKLPLWSTSTCNSRASPDKQLPKAPNLYNFTVASHVGWMLGELFFSFDEPPLNLLNMKGDMCTWADDMLASFIDVIAIPLASPLGKSLLPASMVITAKSPMEFDEVFLSIILVPTNAERKKGLLSRRVFLGQLIPDHTWTILLHVLNVFAAYKRQRSSKSGQTLYLAIPLGADIPTKMVMPSNVRLFDHHGDTFPGITSANQVVLAFGPHATDDTLIGFKGKDVPRGEGIRRVLREHEVVNLGRADGMMVFNGVAEMGENDVKLNASSTNLNSMRRRMRERARRIEVAEKLEPKIFGESVFKFTHISRVQFAAVDKASIAIAHTISEASVPKENGSIVPGVELRGGTNGSADNRGVMRNAKKRKLGLRNKAESDLERPLACRPRRGNHSRKPDTNTILDPGGLKGGIPATDDTNLKEEWDAIIRIAMDALNARYKASRDDADGESSRWDTLLEKFKVLCDQTYLIAGSELSDRAIRGRTKDEVCKNDQDNDKVAAALPKMNWLVEK